MSDTELRLYVFSLEQLDEAVLVSVLLFTDEESEAQRH